jgi:hypothetical protein
MKIGSVCLVALFVFLREIRGRAFFDQRYLRDLRLGGCRPLFVRMLLPLEECDPFIGAVAISQYHANEFPRLQA